MMERKSIYILESIVPCFKDDEDGNEVYDMNEQFEIRVVRERIGAFSSVEQAENAMHKLIEFSKDISEHMYVGFLLDELYLDDCFFGESMTSSFESMRSYLGNGELNYFSDLDDRSEKHFAGTNCRSNVRPGDYAYFLESSRLIPILVENIPFTVDEWKSRFKPGVYGDFFDDTGIVYTVDGHAHPLWTRVFPTKCLENGVFKSKLKNNLTK